MIMVAQLENLNKVIGIRLKSFNDLVRLSASSIAMGQATFILRYSKHESTVYGVLAVFRDYYKMYGLPIFYYYLDTSGVVPQNFNYVLLRSDETGEHIEFSKGSRSGYVVIPVIDLERPPKFMDVETL